jgi:hypothetical protein
MILAFGEQEWFAVAANGSKQRPIGSRVGVVRVRVLTNIYSHHWSLAIISMTSYYPQVGID